MIPKILLVNDDGINAEGMARSIEMFSTLSCELAVFAPRTNQSGVGHAITLFREIEIIQLPEIMGVKTRWQIDGTPVDAIKFALDNAMFIPDLVVSGINNGPNMGNNIHYSGTVGAALEAEFHGINSLALSVENYQNPRWEPAIIWGRKIIADVLAIIANAPKTAPTFLLNINFPDIPSEQVKGIKLTRQGRCGFKEEFFPSAENRPNYFRLDGEMIYPDTADDIDTNAVRAGFVSLTPLNSLMNCQAEITQKLCTA